MIGQLATNFSFKILLNLWSRVTLLTDPVSFIVQSLDYKVQDAQRGFQAKTFSIHYKIYQL